MSIDLIIVFLFLILILLEYILDISINNQLIAEQTIPDSLFLKIIILLIYIGLFFEPALDNLIFIAMLFLLFV